jgi:hypothetical protein
LQTKESVVFLLDVKSASLLEAELTDRLKEVEREVQKLLDLSNSKLFYFLSLQRQVRFLRWAR